MNATNTSITTGGGASGPIRVAVTAGVKEGVTPGSGSEAEGESDQPWRTVTVAGGGEGEGEGGWLLFGGSVVVTGDELAAGVSGLLHNDNGTDGRGPVRLQQALLLALQQQGDDNADKPDGPPVEGQAEAQQVGRGGPPHHTTQLG
jgi:hypothetical protein